MLKCNNVIIQRSILPSHLSKKKKKKKRQILHSWCLLDIILGHDITTVEGNNARENVRKYRRILERTETERTCLPAIWMCTWRVHDHPRFVNLSKVGGFRRRFQCPSTANFLHVACVFARFVVRSRVCPPSLFSIHLSIHLAEFEPEPWKKEICLTRRPPQNRRASSTHDDSAAICSWKRDNRRSFPAENTRRKRSPAFSLFSSFRSRPLLLFPPLSRFVPFRRRRLLFLSPATFVPSEPLHRARRRNFEGWMKSMNGVAPPPLPPQSHGCVRKFTGPVLHLVIIIDGHASFLAPSSFSSSYSCLCIVESVLYFLSVNRRL